MSTLFRTGQSCALLPMVIGWHVYCLIIYYVNSGLVRGDMCIIRNKRRGALKDDPAQLSNSTS